jgi:hypothetical protein
LESRAPPLLSLLSMGTILSVPFQVQVALLPCTRYLEVFAISSSNLEP